MKVDQFRKLLEAAEDLHRTSGNRDAADALRQISYDNARAVLRRAAVELGWGAVPLGETTPDRVPALRPLTLPTASGGRETAMSRLTR